VQPSFPTYMTQFRHVLLWLILLAGMPLSAGASAVVSTPQVRAQFVAHAPEGLGAGKTAWLGLVIRHQPDWHTYWKNSGDSGLPTQLTWQLPAGVTAGEIQWPTPKRMVIGQLANYGYDGSVLLAVPLTISDDFGGQALTAKLKADWLVCKQECIPQSGEFELTVPANATSASQAALFQKAFASAPKVLTGVRAQGEVQGEVLTITMGGLPAAWTGNTFEFFPEDPGVIEPAGAITASRQGSDLVLRMPLSAQRSESPTAMKAVLARPGDEAGIAIQFAVSGWLDSEAAPGVGTASPEAAAAGATGLLLALALAFGGGLLLNLMPCVFPILSLKVLSFAQHAGDRKALVAGGLAYTVGVVASFVALAGLLLALRAGGEALGWGFQLQSPLVVAGLAILFTLIALNLLGVFEFGSFMPSGFATMRARSPLLDHGLTGVLAVGVASPCTAPFMGVALGAALTMPLPQALGVFASLGMGMAAPYLLASAWPGFSDLLPRPGAWTSRFKVLMAFPMFATVVWLVWVLAQQIGVDGAAAVLALLVAVSFGAWTYGLAGVGLRSARFYKLAGGLAVATVLVLTWPLMGAKPDAMPATGVSTSAWQAWTPQAVAEARAAGQPVFVDFTAAWCVTCQVNKRTTLNDAALQAELAAKGVRLLRADWTNRDPVITQELARLGRSGVPVYALYGPGAAQVELLPEILTVTKVRAAIAGWPATSSPPKESL
jgi:thiol:disulfide interchange protein/DsbC/DsbD-like thiol-disulfide interchange protein